MRDLPPFIGLLFSVLPATLFREYRDPILLRRIMRYGCVGFTISLCYSLAVIGCAHFVNPTAASIIAFIVIVPIGYLAHSGISFSDGRNDTFQPLRFAVTSAASFVVSVGGMYWITEVAGRGYLLGIAWNYLTIPMMNFLIYLFWVFQVAGKRERVT